jgi:MFS family permease
MVFPFYVIFIKEVGANFTQFGFSYALFAISSALTHNFVGGLTDRFGRSLFLAMSSWGTACALVFFPAVTEIYQVYILQIAMGLFGAFQKTAEKTLVADITDCNGRGRQIGRYHAWTTLFSGLAVIVAGYVIDLFTLDIIFYAGSFSMFISGFVALKINDKKHDN